MAGRKAALILLLILVGLLRVPSVARGEEVPLLNHLGVGVAYVDREDDSTIYLWGGIPTAYLDGTSIYGFNGRHLGWFEEGMVWGNQGLKVGYTEDTIADVGKTSKVDRLKGVKQLKPVPVPPEPAPPKPAYTDMASPVPLGDLLRMGRP
jgi:hypothetical protein